ncbi:MAG: cytochrome c [Methylobacteriaceae bacterium]|nr:cytochrome c [Methylobacteriaceae bacterium]
MREVRRFLPFVAVLCTGVALAGCNALGSSPRSDAQKRGADLIIANGCGTCHAIPGIAGARGNVGPPLDHIGTRVFIAGMLRNTPDNMVRWLQNPQAVIPGNAMPNMNLNDAQARDITAYLAELQ